jgi:hypothetical protein
VNQASTPTETYYALYYSLGSSAAHFLPILSTHLTRSMIWTRQSHTIDFDKMFKRSFASRDGRVTKPKLIKTTYPEHVKRKMQDSLESPPVGRYAPKSLTLAA